MFEELKVKDVIFNKWSGKKYEIVSIEEGGLRLKRETGQIFLATHQMLNENFISHKGKAKQDKTGIAGVQQ